jgi:hypothetical protein
MTALLAYLTDTAMLHRRTGVNACGEDVLDAGREIRCRVRFKRLEAILADAHATHFPGEVWLAPDEEIAPGDQVLYDGEFLRVRAVECITDVVGIGVGLRAMVE